METTSSSATARTAGGAALVLSAIILGASLLGSTYIAGSTFYKVKALSNVIAVTGSAERIIMSDTVKWTSSVIRTVPAADLKTGSAQLKADVDAALSAFRKAGLADEEITLDPMVASPVCDSQEHIKYENDGTQGCLNVVQSYQLRQNLKVESPKVKEVTALSKDAVGALLDKGIFFTSQKVEYYYSKLADVKVAMFADATRDAQARAGKIAESTGARLGAIQAVSTGVLQVTAVNSSEISDYGAFDTASPEKKVTSVVHASFLIE